MSEITRKINQFFTTAGKSDVSRAVSDVIFTERQEKVFKMFYIQKYDVNFIADSLNFSAATINKELCKIREKIIIGI